MKMTTKKIEDRLQSMWKLLICVLIMPCPHTSQLILYETKLYTSGLWKVFVIFKDNPIIILSVMPEWTSVLCAQMNLFATVTEEINIVVTFS